MKLEFLHLVFSFCAVGIGSTYPHLFQWIIECVDWHMDRDLKIVMNDQVIAEISQLIEIVKWKQSKEQHVASEIHYTKN